MKSNLIIVLFVVFLFEVFPAQKFPAPNNMEKCVSVSHKGRYVEMDTEERVSLIKLNMNSENQDFGAMFYGEKLVFVSSNPKNERTMVKHIWNENQLPFLRMYSANIEEDGQIVSIEKLKGVDNKFNEGPAAFYLSGNKMIYTKNQKASRKNPQYLGLMEAELVKGKWSDIAAFPYNSDEYSVGQPCLSKDGKMMFFVSDMPGGKGGTDIYYCRRTESGNWGKPINLEQINTSKNEFTPFYHEETNLLFFSSEGMNSIGGLDVFRVSFTGYQVGEIYNLGESINTEEDDYNFIVSSDQKTGYFSSNRKGGEGSDDLYGVNILYPFSQAQIVSGKITVDQPVPSQKIQLLSPKGEVIITDYLDSTGSYLFPVIPDTDYMLMYIDNYVGEQVIKFNSGETNKNIDFDLQAEGIPIGGYLVDKNSGLPLNGVTLQITDQITGDINEIITNEFGKFEFSVLGKTMGDSIRYSIDIPGDANKPSRIEFNYKIINLDPIDVSAMLDMEGQLTILNKGGTKGALTSEIEPIYFDYKEWTIRKPDQQKLDKLVELLKSNPNVKVQVQAYADNRGGDEYNQNLSSKRSDVTVEYLQSRVNNPKRISGVGYGEVNYKVNCNGDFECEEKEHQLYRVAKFHLIFE